MTLSNNWTKKHLKIAKEGTKAFKETKKLFDEFIEKMKGGEK